MIFTYKFATATSVLKISGSSMGNISRIVSFLAKVTGSPSR